MIDDNHNDRKTPYDVGYRKPPKQTQFVNGKSGNSKGRPKGSRNFVSVIQDELKKRFPITEDGRRKKINKRQGVVKQMVNQAVGGDLKAIPILLNEIRPYETNAAAGSTPPECTSREDQAVMESIVKRIREAASGPTSAGPSEESTANPSGITPPDGEEGTPQ